MRFTKIAVLVALLALVFVPAALALRFTDEAYNPPVGNTGQAYSWSFTGAGGCGPALPYQYKILSGSPPPGLTIDTSGLVHGTPTQAGDFSFWLQLSDENPPSASWCIPKTAERQFTIKIQQGLNIVQNALSPAVAALGQAYSFQLTTQGSSGSSTWSVLSGALPAGITLNSSTGLLSGTPTAEGDFTFKIQVTDGGRTDAETYTLSVVQALKVTEPAKQATEIGQRYSLALKATGGRPAYSWSLAPGTALPAGLTLDAATGVVSGDPTAAGAFVMHVRVSDKAGLAVTLDIPVTVASHLLLAKRSLPAAKVGKAFSARLVASGGVSPKKWVILGGKPGLLPAGIKLNARTGALSGTPRKAGTYHLRIQVTDKLGVKSAAGLVLKVHA